MTGAGKVTAQIGRKALMWLPAVVLAAGTGALLPLGAASASASWTQGHHVLKVSTRGSDHGNCRQSPCRTLGYALTQAGPGDTIVIRPGTYRESGNANVVPPRLKGLTIRSTGSAASTVINAKGNANGILIWASGVSVRGLTVKNANLEGILAEPRPSSWPKTPTSPPVGISHVTIAGNVAVHNDKAYNTSLPPMAACPSSVTDADDCGEAIHFIAVSWSKVIGNRVANNVGGILVSDGGFGISVGPAAHNVIVGNVSNGNGAAGLLDATPYPGTGSYNNVFIGNSASGNGNSGFVLHSHAPLQDVSGIFVVGNRFGPNNLAGDPDTGVKKSTGVMLLSVAVPTKIVVAGNKIFDNVNGVAFNSLIKHVGHNRFANVIHHYFLYTPPA